jgi:hypothetical protein
MHSFDNLTIESLPYELLFEIALRLDDVTLLSLNQVSRWFNSLCHDERLWKHRFYRRFPEFISAVEQELGESPMLLWRQVYQLTVDSPLFNSPEFRELYQEIRSQVPQLRFIQDRFLLEHTNLPLLHHPNSAVESSKPSDQPSQPSMILRLFETTRSQRPSSKSKAVIYMLFPDFLMPEQCDQLNEHLKPILQDLVYKFGYAENRGTTLTIDGHIIEDPEGAIIWVPLEKPWRSEAYRDFDLDLALANFHLKLVSW